jgi:hypothetical protein
MQYLPTPNIVLSSLKTVLFVNESMGRFLGLPGERYTTSILKGKSLSQIGVDMVSDGVPVWVSWEKFLDNIAAGTNCNETPSGLATISSSETTPTTRQESIGSTEKATLDEREDAGDRTIVHDTVVDIVVSSLHRTNSETANHRKHHRVAWSPSHHISARLIISIWKLRGQKFFPLTFTASTGLKTLTHSTPSQFCDINANATLSSFRYAVFLVKSFRYLFHRMLHHIVSSRTSTCDIAPCSNIRDMTDACAQPYCPWSSLPIMNVEYIYEAFPKKESIFMLSEILAPLRPLTSFGFADLRPFLLVTWAGMFDFRSLGFISVDSFSLDTNAEAKVRFMSSASLPATRVRRLKLFWHDIEVELYKNAFVTAALQRMTGNVDIICINLTGNRLLRGPDRQLVIYIESCSADS